MPATSAIVSDFDGTLSPIVEDPTGARPLKGTPEALARLAVRFGVVAVVSGRPVSFLAERLGRAPELGGVHLVGLYGMEWREEDGSITRDPDAEQWWSSVADAVRRLRAMVPTGAVVEEKGLAVTVHWRQAPESEERVKEAVASESQQSGLRAHPGRMSIELRPPLDVDKGSVIRGLIKGSSAACYLGDDLGDLPAYAALAELSAEVGMATVSAAVVDDQSDAAVIAAADVALAGPAQVLALLEWLAAA
jgi:trehalose 6-phosphate phosphatase